MTAAPAVATSTRERLAVALEGTFRCFRYRNFRWFFAGQVVSQVGNWITRIALTLLVHKLTDNGLAVGLIVACEFLPLLLLGLWAGVVVDRWEKRRLLIIVQSFAMLQSFALAALAFMDDPPLAGLFAVALAGGLASAFDFPGRRAFVLQMVPRRDVPNAIGINTALMNLARIVGPAIAGLLIVTVDYGWAFTVDAFTYVAVLVGLFMIDPDEMHNTARSEKAPGQMRAGLAYARSVPTIWIPLTVMAIVGTLTFNFGVVLPLLADDTFHRGDGTTTLLYSVLSVGSFAGALVGARRSTVTLRTVYISCSAFGIAMVAFGIAPTLVWAFVIVVVVGWASTYFMTAASSIVQIDTAPEMQGRIGALQSIMLVGSTPIGSPIIGYVSEVSTPRVGVLLGAVAALGAAAWCMLTSRRFASQPTPAVA
ncbi:MAG TPA: MFS transporter [Acidimicrobiales bacterium]